MPGRALTLTYRQVWPEAPILANPERPAQAIWPFFPLLGLIIGLGTRVALAPQIGRHGGGLEVRVTF
jgi:hypothetical protein